MIKIIDKVETGKTKQLLAECIKNEGIFVCKNPQRVADKVINYGFGIDSVNKIKAMSYDDFVYSNPKGKPIYIDDIEKFLINYNEYIMGFVVTDER